MYSKHFTIVNVYSQEVYTVKEPYLFERLKHWFFKGKTIELKRPSTYIRKIHYSQDDDFKSKQFIEKQNIKCPEVCCNLPCYSHDHLLRVKFSIECLQLL
jgi:hypothetical protein